MNTKIMQTQIGTITKTILNSRKFKATKKSRKIGKPYKFEWEHLEGRQIFNNNNMNIVLKI